MSLILERSNNARIKTHGLSGDSDVVFIDEKEIGVDDFFAMVYYVLTNTDLYPDDPRLKFVSRIKKMKKVKGYMQGRKHLK